MQVQMLVMGVWMYAFTYFFFPTVLLAIILLGTCVTVSLTYRQRKMLVKIFAQSRLVPYVRKGYVRAAVSHRLVPGDVIVVQPGYGACDMVLLRGNCLVEDSMLSGEVNIFSWLFPTFEHEQQIDIIDATASNNTVPCRT